MATKKPKNPAFVTPVGKAKYAWLNKPDTKFAKNDQDGDFKIRILFDDNEAAREWCDRVVKSGLDFAKETGVKLKKNYKAPFICPEDIDEDDFIPDPDTGKALYDEDYRGKIFFETKSKYKPGLIDSAKKELPEDILIMSGDTVRVKFKVNPYEGLGSGLNFRLAVVQLIEKNTTFSGGGVDTDGFDEVEGGYRAHQRDEDEDEAF